MRVKEPFRHRSKPSDHYSQHLLEGNGRNGKVVQVGITVINRCTALCSHCNALFSLFQNQPLERIWERGENTRHKKQYYCKVRSTHGTLSLFFKRKGNVNEYSGRAGGSDRARQQALSCPSGPENDVQGTDPQNRSNSHSPRLKVERSEGKARDD